MNKIQCEILGLSSSPATGGAYAILLKEMNSSRRLPIIIGAFEAQAIALEIEGINPPRPLTHDLLKQVIDTLGGSVKEVIIDELRENTFFAKIILEVSALTYEIDSRPSDAIAIAVRTKAPIFVVENVMEAAAFLPTTEQGKDTEDELPGEGFFNANSKEAQIASLQTKLREAIESEEYERAAKLRDDIQKLTNQN
ncbi:MAG: bifunctional nuclease family protein [Bacteroidetes bacterium]|nr:bifunctional nuclease family protein [Bacteroidota bacterium]MCH8941873.1 bifunctional nuclease family protein [Bacteroidota bacterium]